MQPCDSAGASFASAPTATAYVANDRQTQATAARGWTTSTVLSFIRFTPWVAGTPNIEGVLIGEKSWQHAFQGNHHVRWGDSRYPDPAGRCAMVEMTATGSQRPT